MGVDTVNQTVVSKQELPAWYVDYLTPLLQKATSQMGGEYQEYGGPRIAGFNPDQQASFDAVRNMQGFGNDMMAQGIQSTIAAGGRDTGAAATPYYGAANNTFGRLSDANTGAAFGTRDASLEGVQYQRDAASGSSLDAANPYIQQSVAPMGIAAASPFLNAASSRFTDSAADYMSPYMSGVLDQIATRGARNLSENLLPTISDQFVRAGQYGSPQQRDIIGRSIRDTQEAILAEQAGALDRGYAQAGQLFNQDQSRMAGLAGTAGGLGVSQQQVLQGAGSQIGGLSNADLARLAQAGVNISGIANAQGQLYGEDLNRQLAAAQGQVGIGQSLIQAQQADAARQLAAGAQIGDLTALNQNMLFNQIAAQNAAGQEQQGLQQQRYDTAYQDFLNQQQYPWQQIQNASSVIHGLPAPVSGTQQSTTTQPKPSPVSQLAGIGVGVAGLAGSGVFKAKGGRVRKQHSYGNVPRRGISFAERAA